MGKNVKNVLHCKKEKTRSRGTRKKLSPKIGDKYLLSTNVGDAGLLT